MKQFMNMNPSIEEFNILLTYYLPLYVSQSQNNNEVFCSTYLCKILTTALSRALLKLQTYIYFLNICTFGAPN